MNPSISWEKNRRWPPGVLNVRSRPESAQWRSVLSLTPSISQALPNDIHFEAVARVIAVKAAKTYA